jgi:hypothetical protein
MGELIQIFIPKCHIRQLFYGTGMHVGLSMCQVYKDRKLAEDTCRECMGSGISECPVGEPGIYSFTVDIGYEEGVGDGG